MGDKEIKKEIAGGGSIERETDRVRKMETKSYRYRKKCNEKVREKN